MASSSGVRRDQGDAAMLVPNKYRSKKTRQADAQSGEQGDLSVLRPSISVNVTGMKQAVKALNNGSEEVRLHLTSIHF